MDGGDPIHDLCRALTNAAIARAERANGTRIANFEFVLGEWRYHGGRIPSGAGENLCFTLDDKTFGAKLAAADNFAGLEDEVRDAFRTFGQEHFRTERLLQVCSSAAPALAGTPAYEDMGERQVAAGAYQSVIRYRDHVLPVMEALRRHSATPALTG